MDNNTNTIAGWTLAGCFAALGLTIVGGMIYHSGEPKKEGFPIEAAAEGGGDAGAADVPIASLFPAADAAKGAEVFKKCSSCHTVTQGGANGQGPNLYGVVGDSVAEGRGGFAFSDALKSKGGKWGFDELNAWLASPRKYAPGTKMTFAGLSDPKQRADLIVYLNTQGSNLPLPPPPAAGAAPAAGNAAAPADAAAPASPSDGKGNAATGAETKGNPAAAAGAPSNDPEAAKRAAK